ncbi:MAG: hypothetical protein EON60_01485 [Alphaproteobacteria bacterium]|nr:MAG: hypothetical protein EON60_01485 [Alphaproteobacteria bacterium]
MSGSATATPTRTRRALRIAMWILLAAVLYPVSVALLVSAYWLKTDYGYNMLTQGGWHAFSRCLVQQIPVTTARLTDSSPR